MRRVSRSFSPHFKPSNTNTNSMDHPIVHGVTQDLKAVPLYAWPLVPVVLVAAYLIVPYLLNTDLQRFQGPTAARFTRLWLAHTSRHGVRSIKVRGRFHVLLAPADTCSIVQVNEQHQKYGKFVRIGPNE